MCTAELRRYAWAEGMRWLWRWKGRTTTNAWQAAEPEVFRRPYFRPSADHVGFGAGSALERAERQVPIAVPTRQVLRRVGCRPRGLACGRGNIWPKRRQGCPELEQLSIDLRSSGQVCRCRAPPEAVSYTHLRAHETDSY